jgi:hypothetical protein
MHGLSIYMALESRSIMRVENKSWVPPQELLSSVVPFLASQVVNWGTCKPTSHMMAMGSPLRVLLFFPFTSFQFVSLNCYIIINIHVWWICLYFIVDPIFVLHVLLKETTIYGWCLSVKNDLILSVFSICPWSVLQYTYFIRYIVAMICNLFQCIILLHVNCRLNLSNVHYGGANYYISVYINEPAVWNMMIRKISNQKKKQERLQGKEKYSSLCPVRVELILCMMASNIVLLDQKKWHIILVFHWHLKVVALLCHIRL